MELPSTTLLISNISRVSTSTSTLCITHTLLVTPYLGRLFTLAAASKAILWNEKGVCSCELWRQ